MTPPHGHNVSTELSDSGEREISGSGLVTRDAMRVAILRHKDDCDLHEKVDKLRIWVARASVLGLIATISAPVFLAWWLSSRLPPQQQTHSADAPVLINQAHAETKGPTP